MLAEIVELHHRVLEQSGGAAGIRDQGRLESALAQPQMTFDGHDLYETVCEKPAALAYSLVMNHPFVDGNTRVSHAAMETFLVLNGYETVAPVDEQEHVFLSLAAGVLPREEFEMWVRDHLSKVDV
jgi:death-on-curing protein